jgi:Protein of unknown function (DUF3175)
MPTKSSKKSPEKSAMAGGKKYWVHKVKTVSTFPPAGTFNKDAETVARIMANKKVSPRGIGSGIRMIQYFINRAGKGLPPERKKELEKAKRILQERARREKETSRKK